MNTLQEWRYNGHLYNWYDTVTLAPLHPKYVSSVDSGNLAAHLTVLRQGLLALKQDKIFSIKIFDGMMDTVEVMLDKKEKKVVIEQFKKELDIIRATPPLTLHETLDSLDSLEKVYGQLAGSFSSNEDQHSILFPG